ncbi:hypothetical protein V6R98_14670 [Agrobacterium sp. CCNWLW71]|uniref:hypothetical protein n=1 Tax=unclassified Agrobacterium TaxID=2632611 RepID=UPI002FEEDC7F
MSKDYDDQQIEEAIPKLFRELTEKTTKQFFPVRFDFRHEFEAVTKLTTMFAWPEGFPESAYDVLTIRSFDGDLPALCASPFDSSMRPRKVNSNFDLIQLVNTLLDSDAAREIFSIMTDRVLEQHRTYVHNGQLKRVDHDRVQLGYPFYDSRGTLCAALSVNGVSGYVKLATLRKLATPPGEKGSAYGSKDRDSYFAKFSLLGPARMTLNEIEVSELVNWSQHILSWKPRE